MGALSRCFVIAACSVVTVAGQAQVSGPVIDGLLNDAIWKGLSPEKLIPSETGVPPEMGGDVRVTIVGRYLCVAARLPEPSGRITARLIGRNPVWEDEDLLRVIAGPDIGYTDREIKINPLGAYSVERNGQLVHPGADQYLVATHIGEKEWIVELGFPLNLVSAPGPERILVRIERIRAARPGYPQMLWHWPPYGPVAKVGVTTGDWNLPAPQFRPAPLSRSGPPLEAPRVETLPPLDSGWDDGVWSDVYGVSLLRDEPAARLPRFQTEVKLVHDGRMLALLAQCMEPGEVLLRQQPAPPRAAPEDTFGLYLATSGSAYAGFTINPSGIRDDFTGVAGGPRVSRARNWESGARSHVRETARGWTVRLDVPLDKVAALLGEGEPPAEWRLLLRRERPSRAGEPLEISVLPVVASDTPICPARYQRLVLSEHGPKQVTPWQGSTPKSGQPPFETRVFSAEQRRRMNLADMLNAQLRSRVQDLVQKEDRAWSEIRTRAEWERFRDPRIKALAASLGEFPSRTPLNVHVTQEFAGKGYRRQDLVYQSRPGLWVTASLYLPEKTQGRMPGFVIVHSHHRPRTQAELQDMGILWARVGCAVLIPDQIGHGERIQNYPWNREAYHSRYMMGMQLYLAGESLIKWMVWDVRRGIDLLLERKDINPEQIILLGSVAAGGEPASITAALDERVAAVAPFNFGRTGAGWGEWESTRCLRRSIVDGFLAWVINGSVAPRRLIYANEMGWESYRNHEAWQRYQKIFSFYGVPDHLDETHGFGAFPGPGECTNIGPTQRQNMYPELNRWFGIPAPSEEPQDRRPEMEIRSLTPALAFELQMKPIHELGREIATARLNAARKQMLQLTPEARRAWLRDKLTSKLGDIQPNIRPEAILRWRKQWKDVTVEAISLEVESGILVPLLLLKPEATTAPVPVVVVLSQGGKERILGDHRAEVESILRGGVAVCLPDVRGVGETLSDPRRGLAGEEDSAAATEFMLGNTLVGARLKDLRTVLAYLRTRSDLDHKRIALWGDSYVPVNPPQIVLDEVPGWQIGPSIQWQTEPLGGLLVMLCGLYEDGLKALAVRKGLLGYLSILEDNFTYVPNDIIVPGILEVGDVSDIAAALAPRPLLLENLVDGKNRLAPDDSLCREFSRAVGAYSSVPGNLVIRKEPGKPTLAAWLVAQLQSRN